MEFSWHQCGELFMDFNCPWNSPHKFAYGVEGSIFIVSCVKVKVLVPQLCPTLCDPIDCSLSGYFVHGILQARILEWVTIPFSKGSSDPQIKPGSPTLQADSLSFLPPGKPHQILPTNPYLISCQKEVGSG